MFFLLSAKQEGEFLSWRGVTDYLESFHGELLDSFSGGDFGLALHKLQQLESELDEIKGVNADCFEMSLKLREKLATVTDSVQLFEITASFYTVLYNHVLLFNSPVVFYQESRLYLKSLGDAVLRISKERLGLLERHLPEHTLIVLGPAGRHEFSPFCPLQMLLLCRNAEGLEYESLRQYGALISDSFETCGLMVDPFVNPKNSEWCGSFNSWQSRLTGDFYKLENDELIDLLRLSDQAIIAGSLQLGADFYQLAKKSLSSSHIALENLVSRISLLSNGLGILGRLQLEKSGPYRGRFPLLEHALQPLTSAISAFALIANLINDTSTGRVCELLQTGGLNVDMAEQLLKAWYTINELRLLHEQKNLSNRHDVAPLHLNMESLSYSQQQSLHDALDIIGVFQHYLYSTYTAEGK